MQLNIIGNGFDLYHGVPSSYYFFGCYLISNDAEFYEEIGKMYNIRLIGDEVTIARNVLGCMVQVMLLKLYNLVIIKLYSFMNG